MLNNIKGLTVFFIGKGDATDKPLTCAEHDEFCKPMESEHHRLADEYKRPGRRAALSEDIIRQMQALATNAGCLAVSMKNMAKIQAEQAELGQFIYQSCILDIQPG